MNRPILLWCKLLAELGQELGVDTDHDRKTAVGRLESEGDGFLAITLPKFRKTLERSLAEGKWVAQSCTAFAMHKGLPRFLGGFLELIFRRADGVILDEPNPDAIRAFRQITGLFGSFQPEGDLANGAGVSDRRLRAAFRGYIETDTQVLQHSRALTGEQLAEFRRTLDVVFGRLLRKLEYSVRTGALRPRHTTGGTADRLRGNKKYTFPEWTDRLEELFPYADYTVPSASLLSHRLCADGEGLNVVFRSPESELPVRVIAVPKTREKPRIISMEPSYVQYMQKALGLLFAQQLKSDPLIKDLIQLHRREHNQEAACLGSVNGKLATLDLSEASDRLSLRLVVEGFSRYPWLVKAMEATRSGRAEIAGVTETPLLLAKFASMGSNLTFPIQTIVFTTLALQGMAKARRTDVRSVLQDARSTVRVFGDDIIVPSDTVPSVIEELEAYGFKLNAHKSFWTGKFRESCGGEYYDGTDVSYVKCRYPFPKSRHDHWELVHAVKLRNRLYEYGYWATAAWMDDWLYDLLRLYPAVSDRSPILGRLTFLQSEGLPEDKDLQVPLVRGYTVQTELPESVITGADALMKWFAECEDVPETDPLSHLGALSLSDDRFDRAGRPTRVTLKRGTAPF